MDVAAVLAAAEARRAAEPARIAALKPKREDYDDYAAFRAKQSAELACVLPNLACPRPGKISAEAPWASRHLGLRPEM